MGYCFHDLKFYCSLARKVRLDVTSVARGRDDVSKGPVNIYGNTGPGNSNWTTQHGPESKEARFIESVRDSYFHQHVEEATRIRGNDEPSTLDLIFTKGPVNIYGNKGPGNLQRDHRFRVG